MARCIFIDPSGDVCTKPMPKGLGGLQAMVGGDNRNFQSVVLTAIPVPDFGDTMYVDRNCSNAESFMFDGTCVHGNAVVVRVDRNSGDDCTPKSTVDAIKMKASFGIT